MTWEPIGRAAARVVEDLKDKPKGVRITIYGLTLWVPLEEFMREPVTLKIEMEGMS